MTERAGVQYCVELLWTVGYPMVFQNIECLENFLDETLSSADQLVSPT